MIESISDHGLRRALAKQPQFYLPQVQQQHLLTRPHCLAVNDHGTFKGLT